MGDAIDVEGISTRLRAAGYMLRYTEWFEGFQAVAVLRADTRRCFVSAWHPTLELAWRDLANQVEQATPPFLATKSE